MKTIRFLALVLIITLLLGCINSSRKKERPSLNIAVSYGLGYAPALVAADLKLIEKYYPDVSVSIKHYGSTAAIKSAVLEGDVDLIISSQIIPILLKDIGVNFKVVSGVSIAPYELMVKADSGIESLDGLSAQKLLAVPGFASVQHMALYLAADNNSIGTDNISAIIQTMAEPIGFQNLISGEVAAHFTTLPYIALEEARGYHSILSVHDLLGDISLVASVSEKLYSDYPGLYAAVYAALAEAVELINTRDPRALDIIAKRESLTVSALSAYLERDSLSFSTRIYGSAEMAKFLYDYGFITKLPRNIQDFTWETASAMFGKEWKVIAEETPNAPQEAEETETLEGVEALETLEEEAPLPDYEEDAEALEEIMEYLEETALENMSEEINGEENVRMADVP
jgi:ABC-type nitrate/sulfonate/bicarbonate transport system substrate-binding protein